MQSQQRPGEVRAIQLGKWDHPKGSVLPASDSCHEQPRGQRLPAWAGGGHQLPSPQSTPFKDRELGAVQRPCLWPQGPLAALHTCQWWRGQTPTWVYIWHHRFLDVTLGKSISPNRFFHL